MSLPLPSGGPVSADSPAALELQQVRKSFGDHDVLRGIDLTVAPHEVICLIGASEIGRASCRERV